MKEESDPEPESSKQKKTPLRRLKSRVAARLHRPKTQEELLQMLRNILSEGNLITPNIKRAVEGALTVSTRQVREIMVPRVKVTELSLDKPWREILEKIIQTGHSRYPVVGKTGENEIKGLLLTKDLLSLMRSEEDWKNRDSEMSERVKQLLRPAHRVPESKSVDILLEDFRETRNHMAIVTDEYGGMVGIVTIEDALEEIVGDIEDEHDSKARRHPIRQTGDSDFVVDALTPIETVNEMCSADLINNDVETIGGLVLKHFGRMPENGETIDIDSLSFRVLRMDSRKIHLLGVSRKKEMPKDEAGEPI